MLPEFYADAAVIAYRIPEGDETQEELNPQVTSSSGTANVAALSDGDVNTVALDLQGDAASGPWVQFDYGHPQNIQAVTIASPDGIISVFDHDNNNVPPFVEASDDGTQFHKIADIPFSSLPETTVAFEAVTARYFRVVFATSAAVTASRNW